MTAVTVAQQAARDLLRAIADRDPLVFRKATELAGAVLALSSSATRARKRGVR